MAFAVDASAEIDPQRCLTRQQRHPRLRRDDSYMLISFHRSRQSELALPIRFSFHARFHFFSAFSRVIALSIVSWRSTYASRVRACSQQNSEPFSLAVLEDAGGKVCGDADVERTAWPVGHDVDPGHWRQLTAVKGIGPCLRRGDGYFVVAPAPTLPALFGTTAIVQSFSGFRYFAAAACSEAGVMVVKSLTSVWLASMRLGSNVPPLV